VGERMPVSPGIMGRFSDVPWGCFQVNIFAPAQTTYGAVAKPSYPPHNTPRYGRRSPPVLARSDRPDAAFRAIMNFVLTAFSEVATGLLTLHTGHVEHL
jgi:hypothetical protein